MEVDDTMITGHLDHARFSGERCGRILNHLSCSHSVFRTGESTRSLNVVSGRMLPGESRNSTSQERVGCGPPRDPPPTLACRALPRAENDRVFLRAARALAFGSQNGAGSRRFFPKKVYYGGAPGLESGKIDFSTISSTYALPFSRTIPVRTPQSASRTEESKSWMSQPRRADPRSYQRTWGTTRGTVGVRVRPGLRGARP